MLILLYLVKFFSVFVIVFFLYVNPALRFLMLVSLFCCNVFCFEILLIVLHIHIFDF